MAEETYKKMVLKTTMHVMRENPKYYLGVLSDFYYMVNETAQAARLDSTSVCLLFRKIRLNEPWLTLADLFGSTEAEVQQAFKHSLRESVYYLNQLIAWAKSDVKIVYSVPDVFTDIYPKVQGVLHCLHVNAMKYLICYNPSGLIIFVSEGFASEISDEEIVSASGYIYTVPSDSQLLVVEGFEQLDSLVSLKNCTVVRLLASPSSNVTATKMLHLRSYIFEMILRIHDFRMCNSSCALEPALVHPMVVCAAGISNLLKCDNFGALNQNVN